MNGFNSISALNFLFPNGIGHCGQDYNMSISCDNAIDISIAKQFAFLTGSAMNHFSCTHDICGCTNIASILETSRDTCECDEFRCNDLFCIEYKEVCNGEAMCGDKSDETAASCSLPRGYHCKKLNSGLDSLNLTDPNTFNMTEEQAQQVLDIANSIKDIGIDIQDNVVLITLYYVNIITSLFIINGLYLYQNKVGFSSQININLVVCLIVFLQTLVMTSINIFDTPMVDCTLLIGSKFSYTTISWFDLMQCITACVLCYTWSKHLCVRKCRWFKYVFVSIIFLIPVFTLIVGGDSYDYKNMRRYFSIVFYHSAQILVNAMWCLIIIHKKNKNVKQSCFQNDKCRRYTYFCIGFTGLFSNQYGIYILAGVANDSGLYNGADCPLWGALVLLNPFILITSIVLLFSLARYSVLLYTLILMVISFGTFIHLNACTLILNLQYITHALLIPVYVILVFITIKELRKWSPQLISMYIVSFNVATDIIVIYYFINSKDYMFAALEMSFILLGQIMGSFSKNLFTDDVQQKLSKTDKILSSLGFGRAWFLVKSWSDGNYESILYAKLASKHQIWELMFEEIPSLILQIYASLVTNKFSLQIVSSIIIEFLAITRNVWMYLIEVGYKDEDKAVHVHDKATDIELTVRNNETNKIVPNTAAITEYNAPNQPSSNDQDTKDTKETIEEKNTNMEESEEQKKPDQTVETPDTEHQQTLETNQKSVVSTTIAINQQIPEGNGNATEETTDIDTTFKKDEMKRWLEQEVGLPEYCQLFTDSGFNSMQMIKELDDITYLDYIGITNKAHQIKIINSVKKLAPDNVAIIKHVESDNIQNELQDIYNMPSYLPKLFKHRSFHISFFAFMISDLYIRSIPLLILTSSVPCSNEEDATICFERAITFSALIICLFVFEFVMNIKMRIKEYKSLCFVIQIFPISILSSFYNLLASLDLLKKDAFFGESVRFEWFLTEHKIRIGLSVVINIINLFLFTVNEAGRNIMILILILVYSVFFIINFVAVKYIKKYNIMTNSFIYHQHDIVNDTKPSITEEVNKIGEDLALSNDKYAAVQSFFEDVMIMEEFKIKYAKLFQRNGFDSLHIIKTLSNQDLIDIGLDKLGHRKMILEKIKMLYLD